MLHLAFTYPKIVTLLMGIWLTGNIISPHKHPLHVSTTEANYNAHDKTVEITFSLFTDDFENILNKKYKQKVDLISPAMHTKMDALVRSYISSHIAWKLNGKPATMEYLGFEINQEVVNVYFQIPKITGMAKFEANNTLLYDLFDDQMSIMHLSNGVTRKSIKMVYPERIYTATF